MEKLYNGDSSRAPPRSHSHSLATSRDAEPQLRCRLCGRGNGSFSAPPDVRPAVVDLVGSLRGGTADVIFLRIDAVAHCAAAHGSNSATHCGADGKASTAA